MWYNIIVVKGRGNEKMKRMERSNLDTPNLEKIFEKIQNPLDKYHKIWYNNNVLKDKKKFYSRLNRRKEGTICPTR